MRKTEPILKNGFLVDKKYTVKFFIKKGRNAETYRVLDKHGEVRFLKLFDYKKLHSTHFNSEGLIKEIEFLKQITHPNIQAYFDSCDFKIDGENYAYLVLDYVSGETIAEKMQRQGVFDSETVKQISGSILNGLKYLHSLPQPIIHNDLCNQNVMLDLSKNVQVPIIIDFGYARIYQPSIKVFYREGLNPHYLANECFDDIFSPQSDLYSVGVLMYHMLFGVPPWFLDVSDYKDDKKQMEAAVKQARTKDLRFPGLTNIENYHLTSILSVIKKALDSDLSNRFADANEMLKALHDEVKTDISINDSGDNRNKPVSEHKRTVSHQDKYKGFNGIAGMDSLKEIIYHDVIMAIKEKELYEKYKLTIPNGMLLYGPPGCGKSFFAEKLAEEVSYNYVEVKPSSLASIYVHGSQEKIGKLFDEARKNAPTILNFDEFDALVPKRGGSSGPHQAGEVNEFLSQLNNCGKDGVFVIASTNYPSLIDSAILRAGRIDKLFYISPPDLPARKSMFELFLRDRPLDVELDYDALAKMTDNYVSSDLKLLTDEASREALRQRTNISQEIMINAIRNTPPSVSISELENYKKINEQVQHQRKNVARNPVGFKINSKIND